ncbi:hypothetical protein OG741_36580 [Streptomyces sp. NBC_01410]|uniref:hypothetical protein n=1 Tax=Streptomyces sp. NBC_01410 TaxID=2903856 RepID=UPI003252EAE5
MSKWEPELDPLPGPENVVAPEITETECRQCGTRVAGLDGRYACGVCGWVNDHTEGHHPLPPAEADIDFPG